MAETSTVGKAFCLNGMEVKDLLATKSSFSRQEVRWMIDTLDNCKIHAMGAVDLAVAGRGRGVFGAAAVTEVNMQNITCHHIRIVDLEAFTPYQAIVLDQQLYSGMVYQVNPNRPSEHSFHLQGQPVTLKFKAQEEAQKFASRFNSLMEQEKDLTTAEAAVSKNNFVKKTVSVGVQQAIAAARQEQATKKTYYKPPRTTVLDELKFSVEGKGQATGKLKPFPFAPPSDQAPAPPPRRSSASSTTGTPSAGYNAPKVAARPQEVQKWADKFEAKKTRGSDVLLKIQLPSVGGCKTMKFESNVRVSQVLHRALKQIGAAEPQLHGLFRRSGLQLDNDMSLDELDVQPQDVLEVRRLDKFT